jgi:hypothetical protein
MRTSKLVLDTNVCGKLLTSAYRADIEKIQDRINRNFRVVVSSQTFLELLDGIKGGDGRHFEADKAKLRLMAGNGKPNFLRFPGVFALSKAIGIVARENPSVSHLGPTHFANWLRVVLRAKTRQALVSDGVRLPDDRKRGLWTFDPTTITRQQQEGKSQHLKLMEKVRDHISILPPPDVWAAGIARTLGQKIDQQEATILADRLDAAYHYDRALCTTVTSGSYNFQKHDGDWMDWQQLFYLSDPDIVLLTDDGHLRGRVGNSKQKNRVLDLREFLKQQGLTPRH